MVIVNYAINNEKSAFYDQIDELGSGDSPVWMTPGGQVTVAPPSII